MALKERYYTVDGQIVAYKKNGVRKDFLTDALGSVTAEVDQTGTNKVFDGRYKPYGSTLSSTGSRGSYGWVGTWEYRAIGLAAAGLYVRARHYSSVSGAWATRDPLWPSQSSYGYANSMPTRKRDLLGTKPDFIGDSKSKLSGCCDKLISGLNKVPPSGISIRDQIKKCMSTGSSYSDPFTNDEALNYFINLLAGLCSSAAGSPSVCVRLQGDLPKNCPGANDCDTVPGLWGYTFPPEDRHGKPPGIDSCKLTEYWDHRCPQVHTGTNKAPCSCSIVICDRSFVDYNDQSPCAILFYEMGHCSGFGHTGGETGLPPGITLDSRMLDFIYKLGCCVCTALNGRDSCGSECSKKLYRPG